MAQLAGADAVPPMVRTAPPRMEAHVPTVDRQELFGVPVHVQDEQTIFGLPKEDPP